MTNIESNQVSLMGQRSVYIRSYSEKNRSESDFRAPLYDGYKRKGGILFQIPILKKNVWSAFYLNGQTINFSYSPDFILKV